MSPHDRIIAALIESQPAMANSDGEIIVSCSVTPNFAVVRESGLTISQAQLDRASLALRGIINHAKAWNWGKVTSKLDRGYKAIGGVNPAPGYDFHRGQHPCQE